MFERYNLRVKPTKFKVCLQKFWKIGNLSDDPTKNSV